MLKNIRDRFGVCAFIIYIFLKPINLSPKIAELL